MRKWRTLEFALHTDQADLFLNIPCVGVHETNMFVPGEFFRHLGGELQGEGEIRQFTGWEFVFVGFGRGESEAQANFPQDMPGDTVIFAVGISITNK